MKKSNVIFFLLFTFCSTNIWATQRYGLVIGANKGDSSEKTLRYAERDAKRISEVLVQLGNFKSENMITLLGSDAASLSRVLKKLSKRISREGGEGSMLLVYYSGHADTTSLHLGGTRFSFSKLQKMINNSPASFKVLLIDACKSGEITRVKGGGPSEAFDIGASRWESGKGMAIITSSAAGEDAQESDRLKAGFFTHNLISGLRGAADASGDKIVTLSEAYDYVYEETLRATSSATFLQHPTYAFDIRGRKDITLTNISRKNSGTGYLKVDDPGKYLLFKGGKKGDLVAEIQINEGVELALNPGTYFVRRRENYRLYESEVDIKRSQFSQLRGEDMTRVPRGEIARKGSEDDLAFQWALVLAGGMGGHTIQELSFTPFWAIGVHLDTPLLSFEMRLKMGLPKTTIGVHAITHQTYGADLASLLMWDFRPFSLGFGARFNGGVVLQTFESVQNLEDRLAFVGGIGPVAAVDVEVFGSIAIGLRSGVDVLAVPRIESENLSINFVPYGEFNVSTYF